MQTAAIIVSLAVTIVALGMVARAVARLVEVLRLGRPVLDRSSDGGARSMAVVKETFGHTRMLKWSVPGIAHWFVFIGFFLLFATLVEAFGELFDEDFHIPFFGRYAAYGWLVELVTALTLLGILILIAIRLSQRPSQLGLRSRFTGSNQRHAYFVETVIVLITLSVFAIRGMRVAHGSLPEGMRPSARP